MVNLSITIYACCTSFFMFINKNLKETAFNYCAQWSGLLFQLASCLTLYKGFH